jgi:hypothetical protein
MALVNFLLQLLDYRIIIAIAILKIVKHAFQVY